MYVQLTRQADTTTTDVLRYIRAAPRRLDPDQHAEVFATTASNLNEMKTSTARHMTEVTEGQQLRTECPGASASNSWSAASEQREARRS